MRLAPTRYARARPAADILPSPLLVAVSRWAQCQPDVAAAALVGSPARLAAGRDADLLVLIVTADPTRYRHDATWLGTIPWPSPTESPAVWHDAEYHAAWSRHVRLEGGTELALAFVALEWARREPIDPGTRRVVDSGMRILWDPRHVMTRLVESVALEAAQAS
jgi:hypothetical protein